MFRFTIRDVLWLTVVVAIPLGYWVKFRQDIARRIREVEARHPQLQSPADRIENVPPTLYRP